MTDIRLPCNRAMVLLCSVVFIFVVSVAAADRNPPPENISLEYQNKPLKQVLADLARVSGQEIFVNEEYANTPVTGAIYNASVHDTLKMIVNNLNHTIIYEGDNTIMVYIYEKGSPPAHSGLSDAAMVPAHQWLGPQEELPAVPEAEPETPPESPADEPEPAPADTTTNDADDTEAIGEPAVEEPKSPDTANE
ncbi:MAG: DUF4974 domain-containing protein [Desulfobacteraceae bacterium]|nr:DUF4974 domain-containing protein [Desulfobacteraceae bacterium]